MKPTNKYDVYFYYGVAEAMESEEMVKYYDFDKTRFKAAKDIRILCDRILELEEKLEQGG